MDHAQRGYVDDGPVQKDPAAWRHEDEKIHLSWRGLHAAAAAADGFRDRVDLSVPEHKTSSEQPQRGARISAKKKLTDGVGWVYLLLPMSSHGS